jgi:hypothetical protein
MLAISSEFHQHLVDRLGDVADMRTISRVLVVVHGFLSWVSLSPIISDMWKNSLNFLMVY